MINTLATLVLALAFLWVLRRFYPSVAMEGNITIPPVRKGSRRISFQIGQLQMVVASIRHDRGYYRVQWKKSPELWVAWA